MNNKERVYVEMVIRAYHKLRESSLNYALDNGDEFSRGYAEGIRAAIEEFRTLLIIDMEGKMQNVYLSDKGSAE